jgi:hypothetical protein
MPIPTEPACFEPQDAHHFYAAQGALFLVDPARLLDLMGDAVLGSDLIKTLTRKSYPHDAYREGAIVPALGVDQTHFTVTVRSTETRSEPLPLSHMLFSTGFVLGTETGDLLLTNTDRLQHWSPGQLPPGKEEFPLSSFERNLHIAPGWYTVTAVTGLHDPDGGGEEWVCAFLLDPQPAQPAFSADLTRPLST